LRYITTYDPRKEENKMNYELIQIHTKHGDAPGEGTLSFAEEKKDIPFRIRRIYYIYDVDKGVERGHHAHKLNKQLLFCPYGEIEVIIDDGKKKESIMLDNPTKGLILYPGLWREMIWHKKESVLCVAASELYDPLEYIRNYDEFLEYVSSNQ